MIFGSQNLFTPRSVSQRRVTYFANISAKTNLSANPFEPVNQGPRWVRFVKKMSTRDSATLNGVFSGC